MRDFQLPVLPHKLSEADQLFLSGERNRYSRLKRLEVQRGPLGIRGLNSDGSPALDPSDPYALDKAGAADLWAHAAEDIYSAANWYSA
jgi:hypothetical protein